MIENVEGRPSASVFEERVWGKLGARMPAIVNLDPDGVAVPLGLLSTTLEDMARFGMLFTPSAMVVATEPVVPDEVLELNCGSADRKAFAGIAKDVSGRKSFGEPAVGVSYQFDWVFEDGATAKSGNLNQFIYIDPARDFVGAMFKHGNMGQGIYVDPSRDFCGMYFGLSSSDGSIAGIDHAPGYLRAAAKMLAGG